MKFQAKGMNIEREFGDVADLLRFASSPTTMPDANRASITGDKTFTSTKDFAEAIKLARQGWTGGTNAIKKLRATIDKQLDGQVPQPEIRFKVSGPAIHMGRFMQGRPDAMIERVDTGLVRDAATPRILTIVCNIAASQGLSETPLIMRGAAIVVLVDVLAQHRVRCNIEMAFGITHSIVNPNATTLEYRMKIKDSSEAVNVSKLAYFLGHPSAIRRLMFSVMEHEANDVRTTYGIGRDNGGYGLPATVKKQGNIYIDRMRTSVDWTEDLAVLWLKNQLTKQGIQLKKGI